MKSKFLKRAMAVALSAACAASGVIVANISTSASEQVFEFEDGTLSTADRIFDGKDREGNAVEASGGKFVFLQDGGETASVTINASATGMYNFVLSAYAPYGSKIHNLLINDVDQGQISISENKTGFVDVNLGNYKLNEGENTVTIKSSWGWTYIDCLKVTEASLPKLSATKSLADSKATDETKRLMCYLADNYGSHILSGQQEIYKYGPHDFDYEFNYIKNTTGKLPVIRGFDFLNSANILYGSEDGTVDRMIDWAKNKNGIVTASWHVTVPKQFSTYEQGVTSVDWSNATYAPKDTDFDTSKAIVEGTKENTYYMACLEALATQLKRLQDENVPIILRPLHEAEGGGGETGSWFWWGKSGSAVYKDLWKLTYNTLTETYGLHNIIWEWNSYAYETSANWYPGDEYVDIVAYDKYNCTDWSTGSPVLGHNDSAISGTFYNLVEKYDGKKMVAMAENDSIPTIENILAEKAGWLYFCPWYDGGTDDTNFLSNELFNKKDDLKNMYTSDYCISLDEVPADLYNSYSLEGFGETVTPVTEETTVPPTEETTVPPTEETTVPPTEETTVPPTEETTVPPTEETTVPPTEETTVPPTDEPTTLPPSDVEIGTPSKMGDVDLNGEVGLSDITKLGKFLVNGKSYPLANATAAANADVTHDGSVNGLDLSKIIEFNLKKITEDQL